MADAAMDSNDKGPMLLGVIWTFQVIAFALVCLRLYARLHVVQKYGWDDHFFNASVVLILGYNIVLTLAATAGLGRLQTSPPTARESRALLLVNIGQTLITFAAIIVKLSIAIFLLRLITANRGQQAAIIIPVVLMGITVVTSLCVLWFACEPLSYSWDLTVPNGYCNSKEEFIVGIVGCLSMILVEIFYAGFPWYLIWHLQMPKREIILIGACMSFGFLSAVCSVFRMLALLNLAYVNKVNYLQNRVPLMIWHEADLITQLACIGISVCRPLYKDWLSRMVDKVGTTIASVSKGHTDNKHSGAGFSRIALKTIGGSSVNKGGGAKATAIGVDRDDEDDLGVDGEIKIQRSWRVESKSRNVGLSGDTTSEEHILACSRSTKSDPEDLHHGVEGEEKPCKPAIIA